MIDKHELRERGKRRRGSLDNVVRAEYDRRIVAICQMELDWVKYRRIMAYLPIEYQHEIDTWPLLRWIWTRWPSVQVYVPRVHGDELEAVAVASTSEIAPGAFGVPEPIGGVVLAPAIKLDLVLVPLLGFDLAGNRVGFGRGYYDRFLATHESASRVGLGYECLLAAEGEARHTIPVEEYDERLHTVITERQKYTFLERS